MNTDVATLSGSPAVKEGATPSTSRAEIEDFLYVEAELLDTWKLKEWLELFTEDASYFVPSTDLPRDASADDSLFYIADDAVRLPERIIRLMKKTAHSEWPRSHTRHLVSNVRILEDGPDGVIAAAAFATWRMKNGNTDIYIGSSRYHFRRTDAGLRIAEKRVFLDMESLRPHGRVSIIL